MQRACSGGDKDPLAQLLAASCFRAGDAAALAGLFRTMARQHRVTAPPRDVAALAPQLVSALPPAQRAGADGIFELLALPGTRGDRVRCLDLLTNGSYNYVYRGSVADGRVVIKYAYITDDDCRVFLMENVLHAVLGAHPASRAMVPALRSVYRLPTGAAYPKHRLGACIDDPGHGDLGEFFESDRFVGDAPAVALLAQVCVHLQKLQAALRFQHRDLKVDNLLLTVGGPDTVLIEGDQDGPWRCPSGGLGCLLIDFGMARLELGGEYIGCDCVEATTPDYNPFADLQNLCLTLSEDYAAELKARAPRLERWLRAVCEPLRTALARRFRDYPQADPDTQNIQLTQLTATERLPQFRPAQLLASLRREFETNE